MTDKDVEQVTFGAKVRARRTALGMTQTDLAKKLGLRRDAVGYYENNRTQPRSLKARQELAEALDLSYSYLFRDDEEMGLTSAESIDVKALRAILKAAADEQRTQDLEVWRAVLERLCRSDVTASELERKGLEGCLQRAEMLLQFAQAAATKEQTGGRKAAGGYEDVCGAEKCHGGGRLKGELHLKRLNPRERRNLSTWGYLC